MLFFTLHFYHLLKHMKLKFSKRGRGGGRVNSMVLGKLLVPGRPTNFDYSRKGPTALAVGSGGGCSDIFSLVCNFSLLSPSLWETSKQ